MTEFGFCFVFFQISSLLDDPPTYKLPPYISPLIQSSNPSSMRSPHPPPLAATSAHLVTDNPLASLIPQPAHTHALSLSPRYSFAISNIQTHKYTANSHISEPSTDEISHKLNCFSYERDENSPEEQFKMHFTFLGVFCNRQACIELSFETFKPL